MDMAERKGTDLRVRLASAERLSDRAIVLGSFEEKTPDSRASAWLVRVTSPDHFRTGFFLMARFFIWTRNRGVTGLTLPPHNAPDIDLHHGRPW